MKKRTPKAGEKYRFNGADFKFRDRSTNEKVTVRFCYATDGKPSFISVFWGRNDEAECFIIDNLEGKWKPCATHAKEVFWLATEAEPKAKKTEFAKQREQAARTAKPGLRIYK